MDDEMRLPEGFGRCWQILDICLEGKFVTVEAYHPIRKVEVASFVIATAEDWLNSFQLQKIIDRLNDSISRDCDQTNSTELFTWIKELEEQKAAQQAHEETHMAFCCENCSCRTCDTNELFQSYKNSLFHKKCCHKERHGDWKQCVGHNGVLRTPVQLMSETLVSSLQGGGRARSKKRKIETPDRETTVKVPVIKARDRTNVNRMTAVQNDEALPGEYFFSTEAEVVWS
jgi:hypothetical protein